MVVLAAVFVVGPFTRGVFGVMVVVGWAILVVLFVFVDRPDLPEPEVARLVRDVPRSIGRTLAELYSGPEFVALAKAGRK